MRSHTKNSTQTFDFWPVMGCDFAIVSIAICGCGVNSLIKYHMLSNLLLSYTTGVDMNEACGPEAELESDEDHRNASSGELGAQHQLGVVN